MCYCISATLTYFRDPQNVAPLLFLQLECDSKILTGLVDSGASVNIIAEPLLNRFAHEDCVPETGGLMLRTASGTAMPVKKWVKLLVNFPNETPFLVSFAVIDSEYSYVILGMPFLRDTEVCLDVCANRMRLTNGTYVPLHTRLSLLLATTETVPSTQPDLIPCKKVPGGIRTLEVSEKKKVSLKDGTKEEIARKIAESTVLPPERHDEFIKILLDYHDLWDNEILGKAQTASHSIDLTTQQPLRYRPRRFTPDQQQEMKNQVESMLKEGVIQPSNSPHSAEVVLALKPGGKWRFCVDFRLLNKFTVTDSYPLPRIDELLRSVQGSKWFAALDLRAGYWQIPMSPADVSKTAFRTNMGLFEYLRMPFGLKNAPATFQRLIDRLFAPFKSGICVYLDDILIHDESLSVCFERLRSVFAILQAEGLKVNIEKSEFFPASLRYLGHNLTGNGFLRPDPKRVAVLHRLGRPSNQSQLRSLIGFLGYYQCYIPMYSEVLSPLFAQLKKNAVVQWTPECEERLQWVLTVLSQITLVLPRHGGNKFRIWTDACANSVAGMLEVQLKDDSWGPIEFVHKTLNDTQKNWPVREKEAYAIVYALQKFDSFIRGYSVQVFTDHQSLKWLLDAREGKLARWASLLAEYDLEIHYCPGSQMEHIDFLSRHVDEETVEIPERSEFLPVCILEQHPSAPNLLPLSTIFAYSSVFFFLFVLMSKVFMIFPFLLKRLRGVLSSCSSLNLTPYFLLTTDFTPVNPPVEDMDLWSQVTKSQQNQTKPFGRGFQLHDQLIFYLGRLWVPPTLRISVISYFHDRLPNLHPGLRKTKAAIGRFFNWENMQRDVSIYLRSCLVCQRIRTGPGDLERLQGAHTFDGAFCNVYADIWTVTVAGEKYEILTMIDGVTKWLEVKILTAANTISVQQAFFEQWICRFGPPNLLTTDQGSVFMSQSFSEFCGIFGIHHRLSPPYHPQGNALIESCHRTLRKNLLATFHEMPQIEFKEALNWSLMAYRSAIHLGSQDTPAYLCFGRDIFIPPKSDQIPNMELELHSRVGCLEVLRAHLVAKAWKAWAQNEQHAERQREQKQLQVGQLCLIEKTSQQLRQLALSTGHGAKMIPNFSLPARITRIWPGGRRVLCRCLLTGQVSENSIQQLRLLSPPLTLHQEQVWRRLAVEEAKRISDDELDVQRYLERFSQELSDGLPLSSEENQEQEIRHRVSVLSDVELESYNDTPIEVIISDSEEVYPE